MGSLTTWKHNRSLRIRNRLAREALAEFLGTFLLISLGNGSEAQALLSKGIIGNYETIYWSWGIAVVLGVYAAGGVSGGHINPAVTVAKACLGKFPWKKVPVYILSQYVGAFAASTCVYLVYTDALNHYDGGSRAVEGTKATAIIWSTYPQTFVSTWNCLGDQVFGTAILLICVLAITDERNLKPSPGMVALSVGLSVVAIGMSFGLNCAYAINPARDLAPRIFTAIAGWGDKPFSFRNYNFFWVPIVGPHIGAVLGAFVYQFFIGFHWPAEEDTNQPAEKTATNNCYEGPVLGWIYWKIENTTVLPIKSDLQMTDLSGSIQKIDTDRL